MRPYWAFCIILYPRLIHRSNIRGSYEINIITFVIFSNEIAVFIAINLCADKQLFSTAFTCEFRPEIVFKHITLFHNGDIQRTTINPVLLPT